MKPLRPTNEEARLDALRAYGVLDTPAEEEFDRITRIASAHFNVPIALVSLVDENRQWFKSCIGLGVRETGRDESFCGHAILADEVMVILDATVDPRFKENPLVTGAPHIRFYAGAPVATPDGLNLGTVCIIDTEPRSDFGDGERAFLADLASLVSHELELRHGMGRLLDAERSEREARAKLELALTAGHLDTFSVDLVTGHSDLSTEAATTQGVRPDDSIDPYRAMLGLVHPGDRDRAADAIANAIAHRGSRDVDVSIMSVDGARHLRIRGRVTADRDGNPAEIFGIVADLTDDKVREQALADALAEATRANNAKSELLARASHDLRTPLNAILGFTQLLQLDFLNEEQESNVEEILAAGDRMLDMVNTVLDLASADQRQMPVDLALTSARAVLDSVTRSWNERAAEDGIHLDVALPPDTLTLLIDEDRVLAILKRLLLAAAGRSTPGSVVSVRYREDDDTACFEVLDHGTPLVEDELVDIFEPFTSGIRVSLARDRAVAEAMDGTLIGSSQPEGANLFVLSVPLGRGAGH